MSVCKSQSNGFVLANNVSQDGLWILMWLSWLDMALGLKNDRQSDISSWYAIIRCDELYRVQIPWTLVSQYYSWKKRCYLHHWGCRPCHFWPTILSFCPRQGQFESESSPSLPPKLSLIKIGIHYHLPSSGPFFENFSPHKEEQSMMHKLSCMMVNCFVCTTTIHTCFNEFSFHSQENDGWLSTLKLLFNIQQREGNTTFIIIFVGRSTSPKWNKTVLTLSVNHLSKKRWLFGNITSKKL